MMINDEDRRINDEWDQVGKDLTSMGLNGKKYTLAEELKTAKQLKFIEDIVDLLHTDPIMKDILKNEIGHETPTETKRRVLNGTKFSNKYK
jgi:hypothetical protein